MLARLLMVVAVFASGCRSVVTTPASLREPTTVFLVDYGRHSSLLLPVGAADNDQEFMEYGYGQWDWYALAKTEWHRGLVILLFPSRSALGRRTWSFHQSNADAETIRHRMLVEAVHAIRVERADAAALLEELNDRYESKLSSEHHNLEYGLRFVRDEERYWIFHHCNTEVVRWLRELGCSVRGTPLNAEFEVRAATSDEFHHSCSSGR